MVSRLVSELMLPISEIRIERYRPDDGTDLEMVINYFWNIELSKALYPSLQTLEISLRNSIHTAAMHKYGNDPFWFDRPNVLLDRQLEQIKEPREKLNVSAQEADDVVDALTFGFWVGLFNSLHESPLPPAHPDQLTWLNEKNRPTTLFRETFPHSPKKVSIPESRDRALQQVLETT